MKSTPNGTRFESALRETDQIDHALDDPAPILARSVTLKRALVWRPRDGLSNRCKKVFTIVG
jgi:hypothetical protein